MNLSGRAVKELSKILKIPIQRICIVYDDLSLDLGTMRMKNSGSGGGQKGAEDVIKCLSNGKFSRLKVGIGRPPVGKDTAKYVLQKFHSEELPLLDKTYRRVHSCLELWMTEGLDASMRKYNKTAEQFEEDEDPRIQKQRELERLAKKEAYEEQKRVKRQKVEHEQQNASQSQQREFKLQQFEQIQKVLRESGFQKHGQQSLMDEGESHQQSKEEGEPRVQLDDTAEASGGDHKH